MKRRKKLQQRKVFGENKNTDGKSVIAQLYDGEEGGKKMECKMNKNIFEKFKSNFYDGKMASPMDLKIVIKKYKMKKWKHYKKNEDFIFQMSTTFNCTKT